MAVDHKERIVRWPAASPELRAYCALAGLRPLPSLVGVAVRNPDEINGQEGTASVTGSSGYRSVQAEPIPTPPPPTDGEVK